MISSAQLDQFLVQELGRVGFDSSKNPKGIKDAILKLSDFYIQFPDRATPWEEARDGGNWALAAYLGYNHLMGHFRLAKLFQEVARSGFLSGVSTAVDFGSGSGVSFPFLADYASKIISVEIVARLFEVQKRFAQHVGANVDHRVPRDFQKEFSALVPSPATSVLFLSFVLTEIRDLPQFAFDFEALILVEPGLKNDTRRLMETRSLLVERGYSIWAPCTHQGACPLLTLSERDWCHDKVKVQYDGALAPVLGQLPFDNRFAGFSYLLARKKKPDPSAGLQGRVLGEPLVENGKVRQMVCRGESREFLSFLTKTEPNPPRLERGDLIEWTSSPETKGNEVRGGGPIQILRDGLKA